MLCYHGPRYSLQQYRDHDEGKKLGYILCRPTYALANEEVAPDAEFEYVENQEQIRVQVVSEQEQCELDEVEKHRYTAEGCRDDELASELVSGQTAWPIYGGFALTAQIISTHVERYHRHA